MGLSRHTLQQLIALKRDGAIPSGAGVVEIGAQQLSNAFLLAQSDLAEAYGLFGAQPVDLGHPRDDGFIDGLKRQHPLAPASRAFWQSLGFSYAAVEYGGYRDSISLDLNRGSVPWRLRSSFDLVVNCGTTEHVANQDNAFRVIHDFTKPGGVMLHEVPAGGLPTHGVVSYNMQFFWLLCRENGYEVIELAMRHHGASPISRDVLESNATYGHCADLIAAGPQLPALSILAVLRRPTKKRYVTMLDLPADARR